MQSLKKIVSILPFLDLFGHKVDLIVNSNNVVKSRIGGFFTIVIIALAFYSFGSNFVSWINGNQLQAVSSYRSFSLESIKREKPNNLYEFDSSNYYVYFILRGLKNDGNYLLNDEMQRYLTFSLIYSDENENIRPVEMESCSIRKMNEFLLLSNEDLQNLSQVSSSSLCIKDGQNITMGLYYNQSIPELKIPFLFYTVQKCVNSSTNNFSCASNEEIEQMLKNTRVQVTLPKSNFDFNNITDPRKRSYDYNLYRLDPLFSIFYETTLISNYLLTDFGLLNEDYQLNSIDFNSDDLIYQSMSPGSFGEGVVFSYLIRFGLNQQTYYRKNNKIFDILANVGGTLNFYLLLGKILCYFYNSMLLKYILTKITFSSIHDSGRDERKYDEKKDEENPIKYSFFKVIFPSFFKKDIYSQALESLKEFIDIKHIIQRLHDVDKLKMILFTEEQRKEFDNLPKPSIGKRKYARTCLDDKSSLKELTYLLQKGKPEDSRPGTNIMQPIWNEKKEPETMIELRQFSLHDNNSQQRILFPQMTTEKEEIEIAEENTKNDNNEIKKFTPKESQNFK